jgi:hypothetical protein
MSVSLLNYRACYGTGFGDVKTGINHIKVFFADQILTGKCFKGFE